jgi:hypothetical protein
MKRARKPKQERVTLKHSELMEMCNEQVRKAFLLMATAAADELDLNDDQLTAIAERSARYAEYIDGHLIRLQEVADILEKNAGIRWRW